MLIRGANAIGYKAYPDNLIEKFIEESANKGMDIFRIFDSLNWIEGMTYSIKIVREKTNSLAEACICYTGDIMDPNRTKFNLEYYIDLAKQLEANLTGEAKGFAVDFKNSNDPIKLGQKVLDANNVLISQMDLPPEVKGKLEQSSQFGKVVLDRANTYVQDRIEQERIEQNRIKYQQWREQDQIKQQQADKELKEHSQDVINVLKQAIRKKTGTLQNGEKVL
jgi:hypothetical protein